MKASLLSLIAASSILVAHAAPAGSNGAAIDVETDGIYRRQAPDSAQPARGPGGGPGGPNDRFRDDENFFLPPRVNVYSVTSPPAPAPTPSWSNCDGTNYENPYTTPNGKQFYYNCDLRYQIDPNGWHSYFTTSSFRACIDSCSTNDKCKAIHWYKKEHECWLLDNGHKQKPSEMTQLDVSLSIDSAILYNLL